MKIAVTGATGFVGRYLVAQLAQSGHRLHCWYRSASKLSGFEAFGEQIKWTEGELGDREACNSLMRGCDAVIHAALHHPGGGFQGGEGDLLPFVQVNVLGTLELIEAARQAGVPRFVFISTCAVHDKILSDRPLDETHPTWAKSHYGAHKAAIEQFVHSYGLGHGYEICALRPTGVYGLTSPPAESKWFSLIQAIACGKDAQCNSGGKEVHAGDVARAAEILLTAPNVAGEVFSCCDRYVSQFEVAGIAKRLSGSSSLIHGGQTTPKNEIVTEKIRSLGMQFGGTALLEKTVAELIKAAS